MKNKWKINGKSKEEPWKTILQYSKYCSRLFSDCFTCLFCQFGAPALFLRKESELVEKSRKRVGKESGDFSTLQPATKVQCFGAGGAENNEKQ